ncbi:hypothetical protein DL96DRAFT_1720092 [Flagelloscypha sp. PMI_526]|nr:hypothetical protein DL96DRAFT_1720092 [Flagelloscypha sp. PMI_526]
MNNPVGTMMRLIRGDQVLIEPTRLSSGTDQHASVSTPVSGASVSTHVPDAAWSAPRKVAGGPRRAGLQRLAGPESVSQGSSTEPLTKKRSFSEETDGHSNRYRGNKTLAVASENRKQFEEKIESLEAELSAARESIMSKDRVLINKENELGSLRDKLENPSNDILAAFESQVAELEAERERLNQELDVLRQERDELVVQRDELQRQLEEMRSQFSQLRTDHSALAENHEKLEETCNVMQAQINTLLSLKIVQEALTKPPAISSSSSSEASTPRPLQSKIPPEAAMPSAPEQVSGREPESTSTTESMDVDAESLSTSPSQASTFPHSASGSSALASRLAVPSSAPSSQPSTSASPEQVGTESLSIPPSQASASPQPASRLSTPTFRLSTPASLPAALPSQPSKPSSTESLPILPSQASAFPRPASRLSTPAPRSSAPSSCPAALPLQPSRPASTERMDTELLPMPPSQSSAFVQPASCSSVPPSRPEALPSQPSIQASLEHGMLPTSTGVRPHQGIDADNSPSGFQQFFEHFQPRLPDQTSKKKPHVPRFVELPRERPPPAIPSQTRPTTVDHLWSLLGKDIQDATANLPPEMQNVIDETVKVILKLFAITPAHAGQHMSNSRSTTKWSEEVQRSLISKEDDKMNTKDKRAWVSIIRQTVYAAFGWVIAFDGETYVPAPQELIQCFLDSDTSVDPFQGAKYPVLDWESSKWKRSPWNAHLVGCVADSILQNYHSGQWSLPPVPKDYLRARIFRAIDGVRKNWKVSRQQINKATGQLETEQEVADRMREYTGKTEKRNMLRGFREQKYKNRLATIEKLVALAKKLNDKDESIWNFLWRVLDRLGVNGMSDEEPTSLRIGNGNGDDSHFVEGRIIRQPGYRLRALTEVLTTLDGIRETRGLYNPRTKAHQLVRRSTEVDWDAMPSTGLPIDLIEPEWLAKSPPHICIELSISNVREWSESLETAEKYKTIAGRYISFIVQ